MCVGATGARVALLPTTLCWSWVCNVTGREEAREWRACARLLLPEGESRESVNKPGSLAAAPSTLGPALLLPEGGKKSIWGKLTVSILMGYGALRLPRACCFARITWKLNNHFDASCNKRQVVLIINTTNFYNCSYSVDLKRNLFCVTWQCPRGGCA